MIKPVKVDLPYPCVCGITPDKRLACEISDSYAGKKSELNAILQYAFHAQIFSSSGEKETADTLMGIALTEMEHLKILGELLIALGASPVYRSYSFGTAYFYNACNVSYSVTQQKMLLDDISGELDAVRGYENIEKACKDEQVGAVIARIRLDEELHVAVLKSVLENLKKTPDCFS